MSCPTGPSQTTRVLADVWSSCGYDPAESASGIGLRRASSEAIRVRTTSCAWGLRECCTLIYQAPGAQR